MKLLSVLIAPLLILSSGVVAPPAPAGPSQQSVTLSVPTSLLVIPDPHSKQRTIFLYVTVTYNDTTLPLHLDPGHFRLRVPDGSLHEPDSYAGTKALKGEDLIGPGATARGWLLFSLSKDDLGTAPAPLSLSYTQSQKDVAGNQHDVILGTQTVPAPQPDAALAYAAKTQEAFRSYILDEAQAGGYVALHVDPLYTGNGTVSTADRAFIRAHLQQLEADRKAFESIAVPSATTSPSGATPRTLADDAHKRFSNLESDFDVLASADTLHWTDAQWTDWHQQFSDDSAALSHLYQLWLGPRSNS